MKRSAEERAGSLTSVGSTDRELGDVDQPLLGGDGQRHDDDVEARGARELDEIIEFAEPRIARHDAVDAVIAAVVEDAHDAHVAVDVDLELADELLGQRAAAVDGRAAIEAPLARPVAHERRNGKTLRDDRGSAGGVPQGEPHARELVPHLHEEDAGDEEGEGGGPPEQQARHLPQRRGEGGERVETQKLEGGNRGKTHGRDGEQERDAPGDDRLRNVKERDPQSQKDDCPEIEQANRAADHNQGHEARLIVKAEVGQARARQRQHSEAGMRAFCDRSSGNVQHS